MLKRYSKQLHRPNSLFSQLRGCFIPLSIISLPISEYRYIDTQTNISIPNGVKWLEFKLQK